MNVELFAPSDSLEEQINFLAPLVERLKDAFSITNKLKILNEQKSVQEFLQEENWLKNELENLSEKESFIVMSIIAIGQGKWIFYVPETMQEKSKFLKALIEDLLPVELFYASLGGIVGYHYTTLKLLFESDQQTPSEIKLHPFNGIDICEETESVRESIIWGIEKIGLFAEIYPVGGAADRLRLQDEKTGSFLPAAKLIFCGKTLIERLVIDLQAREYLHYKLFHKQALTPLALMTSKEKDNHAQVLSIFEENKWFGRPKEFFRFFPQPLVPAMNRNGRWCLQGPLQLFLKPGGHGVIWKIASEYGIFQWLFSLKREKALVRQINNLVAGLDYGLIAFMGIGSKKNKAFGFASCPRKIKTSEGINVLKERKTEKSYHYALTNIEYCDFNKFHVEDISMNGQMHYSIYSSNTNLLFIDLKAIEEVIKANPIPGMLVNLKKMRFGNQFGKIQEEEIARLESTMQNIADSFEESFQAPIESNQTECLKTFLTFNRREKTISPIKREFTFGCSLNETPEGCFLDILKNGRELLVNHCKMQVPEVPDLLQFFIYGPSFIFFYHPALGPLYSIIAQKIRKGRMKEGSELQIEIAELYLENLDLEGSLIIKAEQIIGHKNPQGCLIYSENTGKCILKNVKIRNRGIHWEGSHNVWKNEIIRSQSCQIFIEGNGEFFAENITLENNLCIRVPNGIKITAKEENGRLSFTQEKLTQSSWYWNYEIEKDFRIKIDQKRIS